MIPIMTGLIAIFLFLFSGIVNAEIYGSRLCKNDPDYSCYVVHRGDSWDNLFRSARERDLVMRINRMNSRLHPGMRIAIPNSDDLNPMDYSPVSLKINPPGRKVIMVYLNRLAFGAYDADGNLQYWGPVSGGRGYCPDVHRGCHTSTGVFSIYAKEGPGCKSRKFPVGRGGAPMPYCMYFHNGFALHGSPGEVPGYNASHGCVRLFVPDAEWLNEDFTRGERVRVVINQT